MPIKTNDYMKKLFTLLTTLAAGLMLTASAQKSAEAPVSPELLEQSRRAHELIEAVADGRMESPDVIQRTFTQGGITWHLFVYCKGPAVRVSNDWIWGDRLYNVAFMMRDDDSKERYEFDCLWPTQTVINALNATTEDFNAGKFEINNTPLTPAQLQAYGRPFIYAKPGKVDFAVDNGTEQGWFMWNYDASINGLVGTLKKDSRLWLRQLNETNMLTQLTYDCTFVNATDDVLKNLNMTFMGTADRIEGFTTRDIDFKVGQLHIIDTGVVDYETLDLYDDAWGPLHRYYMCMAAEGLTYAEEQFTEDRYPHWRPKEALGVGAENQPKVYGAPNGQAFAQGAFYAATTAPNYDGNYTQINILTSLDNVITGAPEAGCMVDAGDSTETYAIEDSLAGAWDNWYISWHNAKMTLGGPEGLTMTMNDPYMNRFTVKYNGTMYYHYDPENYSLYREVPTTSDVAGLMADGTAAYALGDRLVVAAPAGTPVAVFTADGACLSRGNGDMTLTPGRGIYLVRMGNRTRKVIL